MAGDGSELPFHHPSIFESKIQGNALDVLHGGLHDVLLVRAQGAAWGQVKGRLEPGGPNGAVGNALVGGLAPVPRGVFGSELQQAGVHGVREGLEDLLVGVQVLGVLCHGRLGRGLVSRDVDNARLA